MKTDGELTRFRSGVGEAMRADVGGDLANVARSAVEGAVEAAKNLGLKAEDAASAVATGAIEGARDVSQSAVKAVTDAVTTTVGGVKVVVKEPFKKA